MSWTFVPIEPSPRDIARFWSLVEKTEGCWIWCGHLDQGGYGRMRIGGKHGPLVLTHRLSYMIQFGGIPDGLRILHRCASSRACVRPSHLYAGNQSDNMADALRDGHHVSQVARHVFRGERNGGATLTSNQVREIRHRAAAGEQQRRLAAEFGVSEATVSLVVRHLRWAHLAE